MDQEKNIENKTNEKIADSSIKEHWHHVYHNGSTRMLAAVVLGLVVVGGVFWLGKMSERREPRGFSRVTVGVEKNNFGGRGMGGGMMRSGRGRGGLGYNRFTNDVTKIDGNNITIKDSNGKEYNVVVSGDTSYTKSGDIAKQSDLKVGDKIGIVGSSNSNGDIVAKMIRIQ